MKSVTELLALCKTLPAMTPEQVRAQRISFATGQMALSHPERTVEEWRALVESVVCQQEAHAAGMLREKESAERWGKAAKVTQFLAWALLVVFMFYEARK